MKSLHHTCISFLFLAIVSVNTVLASPAVFDAGTLAGTWLASESHPDKERIETVFVINTDQTFTGTMSINGEVAWTYGGNWALDGNNITWHYTKSSLTLLESRQTETDEILSVDENTLTYRSGSRDAISTLKRLHHGAHGTPFY